MIKPTLTALLVIFSIATVAQQSFERRTIEKRIKPVGQVKLTTDPAPVAEQMEKPTKPTTDVAQSTGQQGKEIYAKFCTVCHASGLAGAPKTHDKEDWASRQSKGLDALVASATKGLNAMPAKGTCMSCTNAELKQAIEYMLPKD